MPVFYDVTRPPSARYVRAVTTEHEGSRGLRNAVVGRGSRTVGRKGAVESEGGEEGGRGVNG